MRRAVVASVFLLFPLLLLGSATADDEGKQPKIGPAKPLTTSEAADAVLQAVRSEDETALIALAGNTKVDPWLVADELCYRGAVDAAASLAKVTSGVDVASLSAYVEACRGREPDKAGRERLGTMTAALQARAPEKVLAGTAALPKKLETLSNLRLCHLRGIAFRMLRRRGESRAVLHRGAVAAITLGWLSRGARLLDDAAMSAYQDSDWDSTLKILTETVALAERRGDKMGAARALSRLGIVHASVGNRVKAVSAYERALVQMDALGDRRGAARTRGNLGVLYQNLGEYQKALTTLELALEQAKALGDQLGIANALGNIGIVHERLGAYAKALAMHERALKMHVAKASRSGIAQTLQNIADVHRSLGDFEEALATYQRALGHWEALGDRRKISGLLGRIGDVHRYLGDYAAALRSHEDGLKLAEALGDRVGAAAALGNIGLMHQLVGNYTKALSIHERVLVQFTEMGRKQSVATLLGNIGSVHEELGEYGKALSFHGQAHEQKLALGDRAGAAATLGNIGNVYSALGQYAKSISFHERALDLAREVGDRQGAATTLGNMGGVHGRLGDYVTARSMYAESLAEAEALGDKRTVARALNNMGTVLHFRGEYAEALAMYERALKEQKALGYKDGAARTLGNVAGVHLDLERYAQALPMYEQAMEQLRLFGDQRGAAKMRIRAGMAHFGLGDHAKARRSLKRAESEARTIRAVAVLVEALERLALIQLDTGNPARALARAREGLREAEGMLGGLGEELGAAARGKRVRLFAVGAIAASREDDVAEAFRFLESGRAGALLDGLDKREALRWKAESLPPALRAADRNAQDAERVARHAYDMALKNGSRKERRVASTALREATDRTRGVAARVQRELKQQAGFFYPRAQTLYNVQDALETDQVLVLYGLCLDEALALVVRHDGERVVSLGSVAEVEAACRALDGRDPSSDPSKALAALTAMIVEPLKLGADVTQVLVSPEGPLCYLPFGALFQQVVTMTPSGTTHVLLLDEERTHGEGVLSIGSPDYSGVSAGAKAIYYRGRQLSPLPATRREVETVGTTRLLGAEASETGLRAAVQESDRWRAVHFACHGLIDVDRPMVSSLALSATTEDDGFLTALEVLRLRLPADLAVLSACETGTGKVVKGEGIVGLTRAFMFAGAPRVICSLWKVDDDATQALMIEFYRLWNPKDGSKGIGAAAALKQAQAFVRDHSDHPQWKHPYYWAAWVLWGLPS